MDEYLSKPLQQNHLIQTILKCATLSPSVLEKNRQRELASIQAKKEAGQSASSPSSADDGKERGNFSSSRQIRPSLESRSLTSKEPIASGSVLESPSLAAVEIEDPINAQRARDML